MTDDIYKLFEKWVYDISGVFTNKVKIYLNNELINLNNFT